MSAFDSQWWESHYQENASAQVLPNSHLAAELTGLAPRTALDAGCGNGSDAVWLARQGWEVTAVDISPTAVARAESLAAHQEPEIARRISWVVADMTVWEPPQRYDLVVSQYVHPDLPFGEFVACLARAVAPGGTLFVVGHDHADSHSAAHAPEKASIAVDVVTGALSTKLWDVEMAESRTRQVSSQRVLEDVVVKARRFY
jgi:2-polyprenyl-3-methyl-5-hydroxy-6-metoxy-1,4-benzoquinol methylase